MLEFLKQLLSADFMPHHPQEELIGRDHRILYSSHHSQAFFQQMYRIIAKPSPMARSGRERPWNKMKYADHLPKVDGIEVVGQSPHDPRSKRIPLLIMTSSREEQGVARGYDLWTNGYTQTQAGFEQFRETVKPLGLHWLVINQQPAANGRKKSAGQGAL